MKQGDGLEVPDWEFGITKTKVWLFQALKILMIILKPSRSWYLDYLRLMP